MSSNPDAANVRQMFGEHRSWCRASHSCTCEFENRWASKIEKAKFAAGRLVCNRRGHPKKRGSYGSNDAWCLRCGVLIGGPPRAGEVGW